MLWTVLAAGVAHARLFTPPITNVASSATQISADSALAGAPLLLPPQVFVDLEVPPRSASSGSGAALGVALVAAGLGAVAGRRALLFLSGGKANARKGAPDNRGRQAEGRASNRGNPYARPEFVKRGTPTVQTQKSGFGNFIQKFQTTKGKSKYGVPIFLPNGNVNPAYLAAERRDIQEQSKRNTKEAEKKRKFLISSGKFELADYVRKAIGPVGSDQDYYQSGR